MAAPPVTMKEGIPNLVRKRPRPWFGSAVKSDGTYAPYTTRTSSPNCAASLDTSIETTSMSVMLKDSLDDPTGLDLENGRNILKGRGHYNSGRPLCHSQVCTTQLQVGG